MLPQNIIENVREFGFNEEETNRVIDNAIYEGEGIIELLEFLGGENFVETLAKGITHYSFRQGPIEDMHAGYGPEDAPEGTKPEDISQLSQEDMKKLNKYMVDKIGFLLHLVVEKRYVDIAHLLNFHTFICGDWDEPDIEKEEAELAKYKDLLKSGFSEE